MLASDGDQAQVKLAGNVDETSAEILAVMEGGPVAFSRRHERYGHVRAGT